MTVEIQTQRVIYQGNGTATEFPFDFTVYGPDQVRVVTADGSGKETERILGTDFSITLNGSGGSAHYPLTGPPLRSGEKLVVCSAVPSTQEKNFPNNTPLYQEQVEGGMDKAIRLIQQLEDGLSRAVLAPVSSESGGGELYVDDLLKAADRAQAAADAASDDAQRAESAADRAENESGKIMTLSVSAHNSPNTNVAADYSPETGMLHLYIPRGQQGETGQQGLQGLNGPQGVQGPEGIQGIAGVQGPAGIQGERGLQGTRGLTGEKGDQGLAGPQGPKGETGDVTTALEASLLQFGVDERGCLNLNYLGNASAGNSGTFFINAQTGELEVNYA